MLSLSRLLCGDSYFGDSLRYNPSTKGARAGTRLDAGPVVVWNCTRACNLRCRHCYAAATPGPSPEELTTAEARAMIDDLSAFHVPVLLLSGGEPLLRRDTFDLIAHAANRNLRVVLSTNGTLIDRSTARHLKSLGVSYVGVSLDGVEEAHDTFRGQKGAFAAALEGIRHCLALDLRVGLRFTITRDNLKELPEILYLVEEERIPRICFYHLVYSGRGSKLVEQAPPPEATREVIDMLIEKVCSWGRKGRKIEVLTVDNHADGPYLYLRLRREDPEGAAGALELLRLNGGNRSGIAIGAVDWAGKVHPDQFTTNHTVGDIRREPFSRIWSEAKHPILAGLRDRKGLLKGRCRQCAWLDICNGNCRARAEAVTGDFWEADPACYLTEEEIRS
ncbi:radical SAM/SPASM domain-containing protein [Thermanaeromonas sp. C210]|uniref:radical SAM/SPASM domain-containing protein n=1 Tax=Thermanaeromonas sp. C210 TaxID=2731925 RepID=UPI00155C4D2C|nr:radical SAM protein [Thermanaeromonas sp. C210]GFN23577.1 radical SAM/SPASM domain-containing protein [Thermanaeromonas sp. C210]